MNSIYRAIMATLFLSLISCSHYNAVQNNSNMTQCKASCVQRANMCHKVCLNNCQQCSAYAEQSAAKNYLYYQHEQYIEGGVIARDLKSYRDPLQCRKVTCNCSADYNVCIQSCGGIIHKKLQVAPIC